MALDKKMTPFSDPTNKVLYFDSTDTAQVVCDGLVGFQIYNMMSMRDSSSSYKVGTGVAALAVSNWVYNSVLRDIVQTITHPGQAVLDAVTGHGSLPQDLLAAGVGYGGYKAGRAAYSRLQGSTKVEEEVVADDAVEVAGEEVADESVGEVIEGTLETLGEGLVDVLPDAIPLVFL